MKKLAISGIAAAALLVGLVASFSSTVQPAVATHIPVEPDQGPPSGACAACLAEFKDAIKGCRGETTCVADALADLEECAEANC